MRKLDELMRQITNSQGNNGQTSQTTDDDRQVRPPAELPDPRPLNVVCYDPENPEEPCPVCRGMGVIKYDVPPDDDRFGKLFRCPNHPVEVDARHQQRMRRLSNLDAFEDKTLENFEVDLQTYSDKEQMSLQMAYNATRDFAQSLHGWLVLAGNYGTGKTHLAAAVGNERLKQGDQVLFMTTPDLLDHLRSSFGKNAEIGYDEIFERMRDTKVLILDDLGVENPSEWAQEKLFQLLNHRYSHRKPTVITTNVNLDDLDPRIRSRLMDTEIIHRVTIDAPDYRNSSANENEQLMSRLPMYSHMTFNNFDVENYLLPDERKSLQRAGQAAYEFAQNPQNWIMFTGKYGVGKTHLAASIANWRRNRNDEIMFLTVPDLLDYLRTTFSPDSNITFDRLFTKVRNVQLLVLDDMGTESAKPWAHEKLFQLLDYRYVGRMPTVVTTVRQVDEINERIASRLIDSRVCRIVNMQARSYAARMKRMKS